MDSQLIQQARALPLDERIELIDALWDSVAEEGFGPPLTPAQAAELDRRLVAHRNNPNDVVAWESIKEDLVRKYQ